MDKTFTYIGDLSTVLDYARWRLDDVDPTATVDETKAPAPFLWDATYNALIDLHGSQEGMALAAQMIAARLAKGIQSFGEAAGVRFSFERERVDYYRKLADEIRSEPPYESVDTASLKVGKLKAGHYDTYDRFRRIAQYPVPCDPYYDYN